MSAARDYQPLPAILLDSDWALDFLFFGADTNTAANFPASSTFELTLAPAGQAKPASADVITVAPTQPALNDVAIAVPKATMANWKPGPYDVQLRRTGPGTVFEPLYVGTIPIFTGLSQVSANGGGAKLGRLPGAPGTVQVFRDSDIVNVVRGEAAGSAGAAAASASAAAASQTAAHADRLQADADALATAADRVQTTTDAAATAADRVAVHTDKLAADADAAAAHADRLLADADAVATAADRAAVHTDRLAADGDATAAHTDRLLADADAVATAADRVATGQDRTAVAAVATQFGDLNTAVTQAQASATSTAADRVQTGLDRANTSTAAASAIAAAATLYVKLNFDGWLEVTTDTAGNILWGIDDTGVERFGNLKAAGRPVMTQDVAPAFSSLVEAVADPSGNISWAVDRALGPISPFTNLAVDPRVYSGDPTTNLSAINDPNALHMFIVWGQSLAPGMNLLGEAGPLTTTAVDAGNALMFDLGPWVDGRAITSLVDLKEVTYTTAQQSICSSFALSLNTRLQAALGRKLRILMTVAAVSGSPYRVLRRGTAPYTELLRLVRAARDLANASGYRLLVRGIIAKHGESDRTEGTLRHQYMRFKEQLWQDLVDDINAIAPQTVPLRFYSQVPDAREGVLGAIPEVTMGVVDEHRRRAEFRCSGPIYHLDRGANDGTHLSRIGYYKLGEQDAEAVATDMLGLPNVGPLYAMEAWMSGTATIDVRFSMPVVIDTSDTVVATTGLGNGRGFDFHDLSGAPPAISSVATTAASDTLRVTLASTPAGPRRRLLLACRQPGAAAGPVAGARSVIRSATYGASLLDSAALYHWAMPAVLDVTP